MSKFFKSISVIFWSVFSLCWINSAIAETYVYKDKHGHWAFSDKPIPGLTLLKTIGDEITIPLVVNDLKADLEQKFSPRTSIEYATLAVVAIHTPMSRGSGFFVSRDGYILTNKHVVKPAELEKSWEEEDETIQQLTEKLKKLEASLIDQSLMHDQLRQEFENCESDLYRPHYLSKKFEQKLEDWQTYCHQINIRYYRIERKLTQTDQAYYFLKQIVDKSISKLSRQRSEALFARSFKIYLKDETELHATFVATSKHYDLALLKLDGFKTPYLKPGRPKSLPQGAPVYAIGLFGLDELEDREIDALKKMTDKEKEKLIPILRKGGIKDAVTSGVITRLKDDFIFTDTETFPGFSGGPLLDEQGHVIGINTYITTQKKGAEHRGFDVSISMDTASQEFQEFISIKNNNK